jgi:hypothetical protein
MSCLYFSNLASSDIMFKVPPFVLSPSHMLGWKLLRLLVTHCLDSLVVSGFETEEIALLITGIKSQTPSETCESRQCDRSNFQPDPSIARSRDTFIPGDKIHTAWMRGS